MECGSAKKMPESVAVSSIDLSALRIKNVLH